MISGRPRRWLLSLMSALGLLLLAVSTPALAHKQHKKKPAQTEQMAPAPAQAGTEQAASDPAALHGQMGEEMEDKGGDRSDMSTFARFLDWLGRTHPVIVHFPIAFFPAALFTAIVGRRRPAFAAPVRFLVVAGGIIAPVAAVFGWLDAMNADPDRLLTVHRWLGTAIGFGGLGLAIWALRRPDQNRGLAMLIGLSVMTVAIVVQGWFGGAMVHGIDHMNW